MNTATTQARNEYRSLRAKSRLAAKAFDTRAHQLAHELADGEDILPRHWVQAAREILAGA